MEDKENADRVGKDQAFAVELLVSSTLALDEMVTDRIAEIQPDVIVADSAAVIAVVSAADSAADAYTPADTNQDSTVTKRTESIHFVCFIRILRWTFQRIHINAML